MKNILKFTTIILFSLAFFACERTVVLDINQTEPVYIIEGLITNQHIKHQIKVTKSNTLYQDGQPAIATGAEVQVSDNDGNSWAFIESETGEYLSETEFSGEVGNTYSLTVNVDGHLFTASDQLFYLQPVDSLIPFIDEDEFENPEKEGRFWDIYFYLTEPQETEDYYRLKLFRNGNELNNNGTEITVFNDIVIAENIDGVTTGYYFQESDTARIEWYSLSREAYVFYNSLFENINNDGGVFSGQPANVTSNILGGAVGYFQTSSIEVNEVILEE